MSDFFKKALFGEGKEDFTEANLPRNRKELFKRLLRTRFAALLKINLTVLLFCLPAMAWGILCSTYLSSYGDLTFADNFNAYLQFVLSCKIPVDIAAYALAFVGFSGAFYTVRQLCWGEPCPVFRSFRKGIASSWGQFCFLGVASGIFCSLFSLARLFCAYADYSVAENIFIYCGLTLSAALCLAALIYCVTLSSTYKMKLFSVIKNGFLLALKTFFKTLLMLSISLIPTAIWFVLDYVVLRLIGYFVLAAFGFVWVILLWTLYTGSMYDAYINAKQYPDYYRRGLGEINSGE